MRRHGRLTPNGETRRERNDERRRDRWLRASALVLSCALLGPPFVVITYLALDGLRRGL